MNLAQRLWNRLTDLPSHLSSKERFSLILLIVLIVIFGGYQLNKFIGNRLVSQPAEGGTLVEGLIGQPKLLSVMSASELSDKTVLSLIYRGLTRTNASGETVPDLAEQWEISEDGKTYTFTLREGLTWHDGNPVTTSDIAETILRVLDDQTQSPYQPDWTGVTVEIIDPITIKFHLEEPAAGFLSATNLPITPLHIPVTDIQKQLIGSGPYKYLSSSVDGSTVKEILLTRFDGWYGPRPYLDQVTFRFFENETALNTAYSKGQIDSALFPTEQNLAGQHFDLTSQRVRALFLNTERERLTDQNIRRALLNNESFTDPLALKLITHTSLAETAPLKEQLTNWASHNVTVEVVALDSVALLTAIDSHDYDLLYVDIDLKADADRFPLWHSSQKTDGLNFSRLDNKDLDRLLEQAHQTTDLKERQKQTEQIEQRVAELAVFKVLENVHYHWFIQDKVRGVPELDSVVEPTDRFFDLPAWHVKTRQRTQRSIEEESLSGEPQPDNVDTTS